MPTLLPWLAARAASTRAAGSNRAVDYLPYVVLVVVSAALLVQILLLNRGKLVYSLDDPYIHMAVAENIVRGTYGVNLAELSAPSSSILYPFLLLPFAGFEIFEWVPLAIAFLATLATVCLWRHVVCEALGGSHEPRTGLVAALIVTLLIAATNLIGVMFTGMEHSLQLFVTAVLVVGLVVERNEHRAPWWLWCAVAIGPLVRYENLALSIPALGYLSIRGWRQASVRVLVLLTILVGGFSLFLFSSGHGLLPTSVLMKSGAMDGDARALFEGFIRNVSSREGAMLASLGALFVGAAMSGMESRDRQLATWCAAVVVLHLVAGRFGWFGRYELYAWSTALLTAIVVFRGPLQRFVKSRSLLTILVVASGLTAAIGRSYIDTTLRTPLGANNIYEQQYQMHRFATAYYGEPVAVNDLGWVSFRNDAYVLDLHGLANRRAAEAFGRGDPSYMELLAREYDVRVAMLHRSWFPKLPEGWKPVAEMRLGKRRVTTAGSLVTFYALDPAVERRVRSILPEFRATLPPGVELTILP